MLSPLGPLPPGKALGLCSWSLLGAGVLKAVQGECSAPGTHTIIWRSFLEKLQKTEAQGCGLKKL